METPNEFLTPILLRRTLASLIALLHRPWLEFSIYGLLFLVTITLSDYYQTPISLHNGKGWDGEHYYRIAEQFANHEEIRVEAPFCYRIGNPILAAFFDKHDPLSGFKVSNSVANVFTLIFFAILVRAFIPHPLIRIGLVVLLLTHWLGPFRFISYYPASNDNFYHFFVLLGLVAIQLSKTRPTTATILLSISTAVGVIFRETVLLVAFAYPFVCNPIRFDRIAKLVRCRLSDAVAFPRFSYYVPAILGLSSLLYLHLVLIHPADSSYSFITSIYLWAYEKPFPTFIQAAFVVFGPALALIAFDWRNSWCFLKSHQHLLAFLVASFLLIYVGGNDTERYWYGTMAVIYILIGKAIIDLTPALMSLPLALFLICTQSVCHRLFWTLPDFPNTISTPFPILTIPSNAFQYLDLYSFHGERRIEALILIQYVVLSAIILICLVYRTKKTTVPGQADMQ